MPGIPSRVGLALVLASVVSATRGAAAAPDVVLFFPTGTRGQDALEDLHAALATVNVVTIQENASVTVPRGACRSTRTNTQAIDGARKTPASVVSPVIPTGPGISVSGT